MKVSSRVDISIETYWDQENRDKISTKTSSTGKGMERREANTSINLKNRHTVFVSDESINHILIRSLMSMALINPIMNRTCGAI